MKNASLKSSPFFQRQQQEATPKTVRPLIVGVLHSEACLKSLAKECFSWDLLSGLDLLEARLDSLPISLLPQKWPLPVIATARHPAEGGLHSLPLVKRRALLEASLEWASAIDIELRSVEALSTTLLHAQEADCPIILSFHDFKTVPSIEYLKELTFRAQEAGAAILKIAAMTTSDKELERLLEFQQLSHPLPVATMGIGPRGKESRLMLASLGSYLNYGWLYSPQSMTEASFQWSAKELLHTLRNINTEKSKPLL